MQRPDIALLIPDYRGGGAQGVVVRSANEMARRSVSVDIVSLQGGGPWQDHVGNRVTHVDLGTGRVLASPPALIGYLRRTRPRLLVSNLPHLSVVSILCNRLSGVGARLIVLEHNDLRARQRYEWGAKDSVLLWAMRATYPYADRVLAVSEGAAVSLAAFLGWQPSSIGVLPNGIEVDRVQQLARRKMDHPWLNSKGPTLIVSAGRLVHQKGFDLLLQAFSALRQRRSAKLLILGDGPLREELMVTAARLGISQDVDLVGFRRNPYPFFAQADIFVLSSRFEGFGVVLIEALACGAPIVAADCPSGPREILADGEFGLLVRPEDPDDLHRAMDRMLGDSALRRRMSDSGPERASHFSIQRSVEKLLSLARELGVGIGKR